MMFIKIINNECNATDRLDMYNEGGCFFITSRILIVDMLDGKLDANRITGLLIYDAHRYDIHFYYTIILI